MHTTISFLSHLVCQKYVLVYSTILFMLSFWASVTFINNMKVYLSDTNISAKPRKTSVIRNSIFPNCYDLSHVIVIVFCCCSDPQLDTLGVTCVYTEREINILYASVHWQMHSILIGWEDFNLHEWPFLITLPHTVFRGMLLYTKLIR